MMLRRRTAILGCLVSIHLQAEQSGISSTLQWRSIQARRWCGENDAPDTAPNAQVLARRR